MIIRDSLRWSRWVLGIAAVGTMAACYIFQQKMFWISTDMGINDLPFILNRVLRLVVNDMMSVLLFLAIFNEKKELALATWLFAIELIIILPSYLVVKLTLEGATEISTPLLSFVHRLIVNPLLMFILLAGLLYQRHRQ